MSNSIASSMITSSSTSLAPSTPDVKRYSLVKWLENSQFDAHNEWLGRLTSVPHTNIIDFDSEELKAGIEINVIRNNGEIWRAQVIIPKTSSNTIDLPPSSYKKIRTKAMGTTGSKLACDLEQMDLGTGSNNNNSCSSSSSEANSQHDSPCQQQAQPGPAAAPRQPLDFEDPASSDKHLQHQSASSEHQNQLFVLTSAASSLSPEPPAQQHSPAAPHIIIKADPDRQSNNRNEANSNEQTSENVEKNSAFTDSDHKTGQELEHELKSDQCDLKTSDLVKDSPSHNSTNNNNSNNNSVSSNQKEWQFLQTAINEAGLTDFYQTYNDLANSSTTLTASNNHNHNHNTNCGNQLGVTKTNGQHQQHSSFHSSLSSSPSPHHQTSQPSQPTSLVTVSDLNIETILQMQCELLDQQKELKTIELETMDHLRQLHQNITKLAGKFESFEHSLQAGGQYGMAHNGHMNETVGMGHVSANGGIRAAKNVFNKLNSTIGQQLKLADNELLKELYNLPNLSTAPTHLQHHQHNQNHHNQNSLNVNANNMNLNNHSNSCHNPNQNQNQTQSQPTASTATTTVCLLSPSSPLHSSAANAHYQQTTSYKMPMHLNQLSPCGSTLVTKTVIDLNESNNSNYLETSCCSSSSSLNSHEPGANAAATKPVHPQQKLSTKVHGIQTQIALNRFLRESVKQKMGCDFLVSNAVSDIPMAIMRAIKKEAFDKYLPHDRRPIKAWGLAMASLRCHKRDLVKNRNKQLAAAAENAIAFNADAKQVQPTEPLAAPAVLDQTNMI